MMAIGKVWSRPRTSDERWISSKERVNPNRSEASTAGASTGSVTVRKVVQALAPSTAAASSIVRSNRLGGPMETQVPVGAVNAWRDRYELVSVADLRLGSLVKTPTPRPR